MEESLVSNISGGKQIYHSRSYSKDSIEQNTSTLERTCSLPNIAAIGNDCNWKTKSITFINTAGISDNKSMSPNSRSAGITSEINEPASEATLPRTNSNEIQIIKPTSVSQKLSVNLQEEFARTVGDVSIAVDSFGLITTDKSTEVVKRYTFTNKNKMQVQIISLGATVTSIKLPDKNGILEDIVLGFDSIDG